MHFLVSITFTVLLLLLVPFVVLILRIFTGKSIRNKNYPPVYGTVFNQLFYFNRLHDYHAELARTHPTFRLLAPDQSEIYTTDPSNIEHILKTNFGKYSKGKYNQCIVEDLLGQGIFAVDGEKWQHQRKLASFELSTRVLRDFSCKVFKKNAAKLVSKVSQHALAGQYFDIQNLLMRCTLDSIFKVGFGVELDCLEGSSKEATRFMKSFDDSNELIYWRYVDPFWRIKRALNVGCEASLRKNIEIIHNFIDELIKTKRHQLEMQQNREKEDILSRFLIESNKDPEKMTDQYLRDIVLNFMFAGKDTTANTLSWFFFMLCKTPQIQEKIIDEVNTIIGPQPGDATIDEFMGSITDQTLDKMHYLHATLTETLRLFPAVPMDGRCADDDDILPDGFKVKKGDGVYYMSYAMGRMPYIWGEDAEEFRPDRWLENGIFQPESPFKFVAFHAGPRICLGKQFSYQQMKIVAVALLYYFSFKLSEGMKNVTYRTMFTLHICGGLPIHATAREIV